jgi:hypothetical protein
LRGGNNGAAISASGDELPSPVAVEWAMQRRALNTTCSIGFDHEQPIVARPSLNGMNARLVAQLPPKVRQEFGPRSKLPLLFLISWDSAC